MALALALAPALALRPGEASAHAFTSGTSQYAQFTEGAGVPLVTPAILLCLVPLGLLVGLWRRDGMVLVWPGFLLGIVAGWIVAPWAPPSVALAATGVGAVLGTLAALGPPLIPAAMLALAALTGALAMTVALEGHDRWELPWLIPVGILLGLHLPVVMPAALASGTLARWTAPWLRIGGRVLASWCAAIAVIYLAFLWAPVAG